MLAAKIKYHGQIFKEIFSSRCCFVCNRTIQDGIFCQECRQGFSLHKVMRYEAWAVALLQADKDVPFLKAPDIMERVILLFKYDGVMEHILHDVKFAGRKDYLYMLQEELLQAMPADLEGWTKQFDVITTIPTSPDRIKERGYDVPRELFRPILEAGNLYESGLLVRTRQTAKLFELTPEERRLELEDCFGIGVDSKLIKNKRVLLCDDIFTSGATLTEAAKVLIEVGAKSVTALAFAAAHDNW